MWSHTPAFISGRKWLDVTNRSEPGPCPGFSHHRPGARPRDGRRRVEPGAVRRARRRLRGRVPRVRAHPGPDGHRPHRHRRARRHHARRLHRLRHRRAPGRHRAGRRHGHDAAVLAGDRPGRGHLAGHVRLPGVRRGRPPHRRRRLRHVLGPVPGRRRHAVRRHEHLPPARQHPCHRPGRGPRRACHRGRDRRERGPGRRGLQPAGDAARRLRRVRQPPRAGGAVRAAREATVAARQHLQDGGGRRRRARARAPRPSRPGATSPPRSRTAT